MKKRLLTLSVVGLMMVTTSCSPVSIQKDADGKQIIVSLVNSDGSKVNYTADDLLAKYKGTTSGIEAYYNSIYDLLIRHDQEITSSMETSIDSKIDSFINTVKSNASSKGVSYNTALSDELESKGVESLGELRELYELEVQKSEYETTFYEDNMDNLTWEYIQTRAPYHIRHILVKTDDESGTSVYDKLISKDESTKLSSIVTRIASGENFGEIAYDASEDNSGDNSSAKLYGSLGIMDLDNNFVSEFDDTIYFYDAFLSGNETSYTKEQKAQLLNIPTTVDGVNVEEALKARVNAVPFGTAKMFDEYANSTKTVNNAKYTTDVDPNADRHELTSSYYPRNVLFNTYFNNHGLTFITDQGLQDEDRVDASWIEPSAEVKAIIGDHKILADSDGNPVLITYNPDTGVHFMIIEKSPLYQKYESYTDWSTLEGEEVALDSLKDEMMHYYSRTVPSGNDNVTNDNRFVTYIKSVRDTYQSRANTIEEKVKGFDENVSYRIFESLIYQTEENSTVLKVDGEGNYIARTDIEIEAEMLDSIKSYIDAKRANTEYSSAASNVNSWKGYVRLLQYQDDQKEAKQLKFTETYKYFQDTKEAIA
jgi:hypothetical protein